jgi:glycosyltransferase involved in cell wall biosynthesis
MTPRPLRVLQLSSDWKWTGPAEPMLQLALALRARGLEVSLACPPPPEGASRSLAAEAEAEGLAPVLDLERARGARGLRDRADAARVRAWTEARDVDVVHCWHTRDHLLALRAARSRRRARRTAVVRSLSGAEQIAATPWNRWLFGPGTDALLCPSPGAARRNARLRGGRPLAGCFGAVDLARFRPAPPDPALRRRLGVDPAAPLLGVVARVQPHRRFDLLLAAAARLFARVPDARLLVVGRGTRRAELAEAPARALGIADRVLFAGYRRDDYADVLRALDVLAFLVPGSDGTCRAVLEAAACGIPCVASRRGALSEIVVDGTTGLLADEEAEALARAFEALLADAPRRRAMGEAARRRAEACFAPTVLAAAVTGLYGEALGMRAAPAAPPPGLPG